MALLTWYRNGARDLPWRHDPEPYRTWLSEVMLQQTRVDTVIPYFERFLERWPTVDALAGAPLEEVLGAWSGLGYYSRARNLHRAAQQVVAIGGFPQEVAGLQKLPGIGRYTAGAIASIAMGVDAPLVDGNVERVLSRLFCLDEDPAGPSGKRKIWDVAEHILVRGAAGDWNQALMELGALVCTPKSPDCGSCPVGNDCAALAAGRVEELPRKVPRAAPVRVWSACVVVRNHRGVLLGRRFENGLLGGLWEPPGLEFSREEFDEATQIQGFAEEQLNLSLNGLERLGEVKHVFTHRRLTMGVWIADAVGSASVGPYEAIEFHPKAHLETMGLSKLARKCLSLLPDSR